MSNDIGNFSKNLLSLQLQLKSLFEDSGGREVINFLDRLSCLNGSEQEIALQLFSSVIEKIAKSEMRLFTESERALKDIEDTLFRDILASMQEAASRAPNSQKRMEERRLEVVNGGKAHIARHKIPLDLTKARQAKRSHLKPVLN